MIFSLFSWPLIFSADIMAVATFPVTFGVTVSVVTWIPVVGLYEF